LADKPKYLKVKKVKKVKKRKGVARRAWALGIPQNPGGQRKKEGGVRGRAPPARLPGIATYLKKRRVGCGGLADGEAPRPSTKLTPVAALRPTYLPPCLFWFAKNSRSLLASPSRRACLPSFASRDCS